MATGGEGGQVRIINEQITRPRHVLKSYPDLLARTYMVPPLYFNRVPRTPKEIAGQKVYVASVSTNDDIPTHLGWPHVPDTDTYIGNDMAKARVLRCLQKLGETRQGPMFIAFSRPHRAYLRRNAVVSHGAEEGWGAGGIHLPDETNVTILHRTYGVLLCVVKSLGFGHVPDDSEFCSKLVKAVWQLLKGVHTAQSMFSDLVPALKVRMAFILPWFTSDDLRRILSSNNSLQKEVCECLGAEDAAEASQLCLCADQLSDPSAPDSVTQDMLSQLGAWFDRRLACHVDEHMTDDVYVSMIARLCDPAARLNVCDMTNERVEVETESEAVAETGERMSVPVFFPRQVDLLTSAPPLQFLTGPPGTGKSRTLYMMARTWLREGHDVHVLSTSQSSRAVSFLLTQQLQKTTWEIFRDYLSSSMFQFWSTVENMFNDLSELGDRPIIYDKLPIARVQILHAVRQMPDYLSTLRDHLLDADRQLFGDQSRFRDQLLGAVREMSEDQSRFNDQLQDTVRQMCGDLSRFRDQLRDTVSEISGYLSRSPQHQLLVREMSGIVSRLRDLVDTARMISTYLSLSQHQCQPTPIDTSDNQSELGESDSQPEPGEVHSHHYNFGEGDIDEAVDRLESLAQDGKLHVIADEAGPDFGDVSKDAFTRFCQNLRERVLDLHLWAATVFHEARPECLLEEKLTIPCRCPPTVHTEVRKSVYFNNGKIQQYSERRTPAPTDGPQVKWLLHRDQPDHSEGDPQDCLKCGHNIADVLAGLISSTREDPEVQAFQGIYGTKVPRRLEYRDVLVLCPCPKDESGVVQGLRSCRIPVRVVKRGDPDDVVWDMALALSDVVTVADATIITGLERKIVVGVGPIGAHTYSRLLISSRCTSKLVWVKDD